jgi:hypothetical protein
MKYFTYSLILIFILSIFSGCGEKQKVIKGYDTKIVFILDEESSYTDINEETRQGWEIKSTRRAFKKGYLRSLDKWGTEYTLQKPIYEEE